VIETFSDVMLEPLITPLILAVDPSLAVNEPERFPYWSSLKLPLKDSPTELLPSDPLKLPCQVPLPVMLEVVTPLKLSGPHAVVKK
jgi:hypothetical protein